MPFHQIQNEKIHYSDTGGEKEVVFFAHGLGWSGRMFAPQIERLRESYRCIAIDFRGQGQSAIAASGYDMDQLTSDVAVLIEELDLGPVHFVGLSMGGFVGMRMAARHPTLIRSLTLLNTSAASETWHKRMKYEAMARMIRWFGLRPICNPAMRILFGRAFLNDKSRKAEHDYWRHELLANDRVGIIRAIRGVVSRDAVESELGAIHQPTLVIVGADDNATPPRLGGKIQHSIANASLVQVSGCGHSSTIEQPSQVSDLLNQFLSSWDHHSTPSVAKVHS